MLAEELYRVVKEWSLVGFKAFKNSLEDFLRNQYLESIKWVDDDEGYGTWVSIPASMSRWYESNKDGILDYQLERRKGGKLYYQYDCKLFSRSEDTYDIQVPDDINRGLITQKFVSCSRDSDNKTLSECKQCCFNGWVSNGKRYQPQVNGGKVID